MKRFWPLLLCAALWCALPAHAAQRRIAKTIAVKIAYTPAIASLPYFVAKEKGFFAQTGLEAEGVLFETAEAALDALKYNEVEAAAGAPLWLYIKQEAAEPGEFRLFLPAAETAEAPVSFFIVKPDAPYGEVGDLKGKNVGTYLSEMQESNLRALLDEAGLRPDEAVFVKPLPPGKQLEALHTGEIDALFAIEPYRAVAVTHGVARVLAAGVRPRYLGQPFWATAAAFSSRYLRTDAETAEKIYRALKEAVVYIRKHPEEAKAAMAEYLMIDIPSARQCGIYRWTLMEEAADMEPLKKLAVKMYLSEMASRKIDPLPLFLTTQELAPQK